jgi:RNAse (barnase) inhibitor barstar
MTLHALESLLESPRGGVWFLPDHADPKAVQKLARRQRFAFFHIEGKNISGKEQLMTHVATALRLPKHFGKNWDALEECLAELEDGADGYVIYYDHIDPLLAAHPDQFETLVEILRDAVASWKEDDTAMVVLLSGTRPPKGVEKLGTGLDAGN